MLLAMQCRNTNWYLILRNISVILYKNPSSYAQTIYTSIQRRKRQYRPLPCKAVSNSNQTYVPHMLRVFHIGVIYITVLLLDPHGHLQCIVICLISLLYFKWVLRCNIRGIKLRGSYWMSYSQRAVRSSCLLTCRSRDQTCDLLVTLQTVMESGSNTIFMSD